MCESGNRGNETTGVLFILYAQYLFSIRSNRALSSVTLLILRHTQL